MLFANQIMICSTSATHVPLMLSWLLNTSALAADVEQVVVLAICFLVISFLPCLLTRYWFVSCQQHMCHQFVFFSLRMCWMTLNRSLFRFYCIWHSLLTRHRFVWASHRFNTFILFYIILGKGGHILYVFGLNSTVCSHIVGVHLSSDKVTYDFMTYADLYSSFLLRLLIKRLVPYSVYSFMILYCSLIWYVFLV